MAPGELRNASTGGAIAHRILLVEDDEATAAMLKEELESRGFRVFVAKDGGQAHTSFMMHKPDFAIVDLIISGESGFEICERLKQTNEAVPVLILSVMDMPEARNLAERVGADGYMTKPFDPNELSSMINTIAQRAWERSHTDKPQETRRIRFACRCGKRFKVSPTHRGRTLTCPECGEPLIVPRHG